jgi:NAD(P)-dependent dehydrogenase (short-subunit alcohol dehydrogenase family)
MILNNKKAPKECTLPCAGKLVVITGATSGIGYYTARRYASAGADLIVVNRNREKSERLCSELINENNVHCTYILADLRVLDDVYRAAGELRNCARPIDILIHNAGVYLSRRRLTVDSIETTFAVHYLAPFVINYLLLEKLKREHCARIIYVGSEGYRFAAWGLDLNNLQFERGGYSGLKAYGCAKTAQILSMHCFARLLKESGVTVNAMHPGMVVTNTGNENNAVYRWYKRNIIDRYSQSPQVSAEALYYLGVSPEVEDVTDCFFNLTTQEELAPPALDMETAERLWSKSLELGRLLE